MRFGKQFEFYKIPEWADYYFDYACIKTILKFLDTRLNKKKSLNKLKEKRKVFLRAKTTTLPSKFTANQITNQPEEAEVNRSNDKIDTENQNNNQINQLNKDDSKSEVKIEIKNKKEKKIYEAIDLTKFPDDQKVSKFIEIYSEKLKLIDDFFTRKLNSFAESLEDLIAKNSKRKRSLENKENSVSEINVEEDELGYAVSYERALASLFVLTSWLHSYHSINCLAIRKIEKKAKKIFKLNGIHNLEEKLIETDSQFEFFDESIKKLVELRIKIKDVFAQEFTGGNDKKATEILEQKLKGETSKTHKKFGIILFYLGLSLAGILFLICLGFIKKDKHLSIVPFFPIFNFGFCMVLCFIGGAPVIHVLNKYKINYIYIFEFSQTSRIRPIDLLKSGFMILSVWLFLLIMFILALDFEFFGDEYTLFSLFMNAFFIILLFLPFRTMYYSLRKGILKVLTRNIFPFGSNGVRFRDFVFGDILTSLTKPFASLILSYCLLTCYKCEENNERNGCNRDTWPCFLIQIYPQFIRFTQCINRLYYTCKKWPHLGNTLKYTGGMLNQIFSWIYSRDKIKWKKIVHISVGCVSSGYNLFWDVYLDWGLGRTSSQNFFLRDKLTYPEWFYYLAIVLDAILRYIWLLGFIHMDKKYDEWKNLFFAVVEIYRRCQWLVIRIENEYLTNPENYRTILVIPELPDED